MSLVTIINGVSLNMNNDLVMFAWHYEGILLIFHAILLDKNCKKGPKNVSRLIIT